MVGRRDLIETRARPAPAELVLLLCSTKRVWASGFMVLGCRVWGLGLRAEGVAKLRRG